MRNRQSPLRLAGMLVMMMSGLLILGCTSQEAESESQQVNEVNSASEDNSEMKSNSVITATVTYIDLEGGFFGLVTEEGDKYLPMNLMPEHRKEGTVLSFKAKQLKALATIQQWGTPIELVDAKILSSASDSTL